MVYVITSVFLILLGWIAGSAVERRHLRSLKKREVANARFLVTDLRYCYGHASDGAELIVAEVVIGSDYFKSFLAKIVNIFGGEVRSFQTLLTRGRREARLRVLEMARDKGYDAIGNIRIDSAQIGSMNMPMACVLAWGMAYRRADHR